MSSSDSGLSSPESDDDYSPSTSEPEDDYVDFIRKSDYIEGSNDDDNICVDEEDIDDFEELLGEEGDTTENKELRLHMEFDNVRVFRKALRDWILRHRHNLKFVKNESKRIAAHCKAEGCNWRIYASVVLGGPLFKIKRIRGKHNCAESKTNKHGRSEKLWGKGTGDLQRVSSRQILQSHDNGTCKNLTHPKWLVHKLYDADVDSFAPSDDLDDIGGSNGIDDVYVVEDIMENNDLEVGMKFDNMEVFNQALADWTVRHGYKLKFLSRDTKRVTVICKAKGCDWRMHASVVRGGPLFQIKTIWADHSCTQSKTNNYGGSKRLQRRNPIYPQMASPRNYLTSTTRNILQSRNRGAYNNLTFPKSKVFKPCVSRMDATVNAMVPYGSPSEKIRKTVKELLEEYGGAEGWPLIEEYSYKLVNTILSDIHGNMDENVVYDGNQTKNKSLEYEEDVGISSSCIYLGNQQDESAQEKDSEAVEMISHVVAELACSEIGSLSEIHTGVKEIVQPWKGDANGEKDTSHWYGWIDSYEDEQQDDFVHFTPMHEKFSYMPGDLPVNSALYGFSSLHTSYVCLPQCQLCLFRFGI